MVKTLTVLGSTGSIGRQCLEVCAERGIEVSYLSCERQVDLLLEQIERFHPKAVAVTDSEAANRLRDQLKDRSVQILSGEEGVAELASYTSDRTLVAISGFAALRPLMIALESGHDLALANKEALVLAGPLVMQRAKELGRKIFPVDSEHSAVWQVMEAVRPQDVRKIILTCSGGAFRDKSLTELNRVKASEALRHPCWSMGAKITIDSATLVNKGFEVLEAHQLFQMPLEQIEAIVHPESVIHSLIELWDGALLAQLGACDMRLPIQLALCYPERLPRQVQPFSLLDHAQLNFCKLDVVRFPAFSLCLEAGRQGMAACTALNRANECLVAAFLRDLIPFTAFAPGLDYAIRQWGGQTLKSLEDIFLLDREVHETMKAYLQERVS